MEPDATGTRRAALLLRRLRRKRPGTPTVGLFLEKPAFQSVLQSRKPVNLLLKLAGSREAILKPMPIPLRIALQIAGIWM